MKRLDRILTMISRGACWIAIAMIVIMMCAVFADVVMRFFFTRNIPGVTELAQVCWVLMALSFGVVTLEKANTMVDIFVVKIPAKIRRIIFLVTDALAIVFCIIVGWRTVLKAMSSMRSNIMLVSLGIKEWQIIMLFAVSFFVCAAAVVPVLVREVSECNDEYRKKSAGTTEEEGDVCQVK